MNERIITAFKNNKKINYYDCLFDNRIEGPKNTGSSYNLTKNELEEKIKNADWQEVVHPDVMPGCTAFKANIPGLLGIMPIQELPEEADLYTIDTKHTGFIGIGCTGVQKMPVGYSYLILGMEGDLEVVFTFHPGEPVRPSEVETAEIPAGKKITKEEALAMGFSLCKYLSPEEAAKYN